ncbi:hypothetical protein DF947_15895 [Pedobacter paludis]|uniref:Hemolysin III n=1 Tax=Pedobacter paludis TaxID=2203212 RepID=A0A317EXB9_9SPHI|nr:hemolysin III family protein [Pedobacter paludis]PWS31072.1 hypothetical protein DF947_15895 [Pedobacter paludis]
MRSIREPVNFFTHFIPALLAIPAGYLLLQKCNAPIEFTAAWIYGIGTFILFGVSAMYHGYPATDYGIRFWQKFDHCCIYLMIAGSYTPTALLVFDGWLRWSLFAIVWIIAIVGCLLKIFNRLKSTAISLSIIFKHLHFNGLFNCSTASKNAWNFACWSHFLVAFWWAFLYCRYLLLCKR